MKTNDLNMKIDMDKIKNEKIVLGEVIGKILTNPFQFNWEDYCREDETGTFALEIYENVGKIMFSGKLKDKLMKVDSVDNHIKFIISLKDSSNHDSTFKNYPDLTVDGDFLQKLVDFLKNTIVNWKAIIWRIKNSLSDDVFYSTKVQNARDFGKKIPYNVILFDDLFSDKEYFTLLSKAFPEIIISTENKLIFPFGVWTFRKFIFEIFNKSIKLDINLYNKLCKEYEALANQKIIEALKNIKGIEIFENPIIKISKRKRKEVDLCILFDDEIIIFEHKGPLTKKEVHKYSFENIFKKGVEIYCGFEELMKNKWELFDGKRLIKKFENKIPRIAFTSILEWGKGTYKGIPVLPLNEILDVIDYYNNKSILPLNDILKDFRKMKSEKGQEYMLFRDYWTAYAAYKSSQGKQFNIYEGLVEVEKGQKIFLDGGIHSFGIKQMKLLCDTKGDKNEFHSLANYISGKPFAFISSIDINIWNNIWKLGFSTIEALEYMKIVFGENEAKKYYKDLMSGEFELFLNAMNIRLTGIEDEDIKKYLEPLYSTIQNIK